MSYPWQLLKALSDEATLGTISDWSFSNSGYWTKYESAFSNPTVSLRRGGGSSASFTRSITSDVVICAGYYIRNLSGTYNYVQTGSMVINGIGYSLWDRPSGTNSSIYFRIRMGSNYYNTAELVRANGVEVKYLIVFVRNQYIKFYVDDSLIYTVDMSGIDYGATSLGLQVDGLEDYAFYRDFAFFFSGQQNMGYRIKNISNPIMISKGVSV